MTHLGRWLILVLWLALFVSLFIALAEWSGMLYILLPWQIPSSHVCYHSGTSRGVPFTSVLFDAVTSNNEASLRYYLKIMSSNNLTIYQEFIILNRELYIWQEGDSQGYVIPLLKKNDWTDNHQRGPECKAWKFDASIFVLPTTIDFKLLSDLSNPMVLEKFRAILKPDVPNYPLHKTTKDELHKLEEELAKREAELKKLLEKLPD